MPLSAPHHALLVDDDPIVLAQIAGLLRPWGWQAHVARDLRDAARLLETAPVDVILLDVHLGTDPGIRLLEQVRCERPSLPVVMLTADSDRERAIEALELGALDYLLKPVQPEHLLRVLRSSIASSEPVSSASSVAGFDFECLEMRALLAQLRRIAPTPASVLLQGESGTGKERIARAIHQLSVCATGPFVPINCAAIPENLQESQLFGHERGAFTGAVGRHAGHFEAADGGTLFLDEVAELSVAVQAKLLRALQERTFFRVGGSTEIRSNFRVVAASHRDLHRRVEEGSFRLDLYYRLAVFEVDVPPLRARGPDLVRLATSFYRSALGTDDASLPRTIVERLYAYPWPGNVRELQNTMQRLAVLSAGRAARLDDLPPRIRDFRTPSAHATPHPASPPTPPVLLEVPSLRLAEIEHAAIQRALAECRGSVQQAARLLGIGRTTLYRKLQEAASLGSADGDPTA